MKNEKNGRNGWKKILIFLLCIQMIVVQTVPALALETQPRDTFSYMENSSMPEKNLEEDMVLEGTNGFGRLFAEEYQMEQEREEELYAVTDIKIEDNLANVSYNTLEDASILVALYDETDHSLLASGKGEVSVEENEAEIVIETDVMPQYFLVEAYLLDTETMRPLSKSFISQNYTEAFQEFLSKTTDDFASDRVLNLDTDTKNNFAVYKDDTVVLEEQPGVNTIEYADYDNESYILGNISEEVRNLKKDNILSCDTVGDEILIVKIAAIDVKEDGTAAISGAAIELEEVFDYIKIDTDESQEEPEIELDKSVMDESLSLIEADTPASRKIEAEGKHKIHMKFNLEKKWGDKENSAKATTENKAEAVLDFEVEIGIKLYLYRDWKYFEVGLNNYGVGIKGSISGKTELGGLELKLANPSIRIFHVIKITLNPKVVLEASGEVELDVGLRKGKMLPYYSSDEKKIGWKNKLPKPYASLKTEGTIFLGLSLEPTVSVIDERIAKAGIEGQSGIEVKGTQEQTTEDDEKHSCILCIDGDIHLKNKIEAEMVLLNSRRLKFSATLKEWKIKVKDFYFSVDKAIWGWGTCPYISYKVDVEVLNKNNLKQKLKDVIVSVEYLPEDIKTDEKGKVAFYLPNGEYELKFKHQGKTETKEIEIEDHARDLKIKLESTGTDDGNGSISGGGSGGGGGGSIPGDGSGDSGSTPGEGENPDGGSGEAGDATSGSCGENVKWKLSENGTLTIYGTGAMEDYVIPGNENTPEKWETTPWSYKGEKIRKIIVEPGVETIGRGAFEDLIYAENVELPEGLRKIGVYAFVNCVFLSAIEIPESVTEIEPDAFLNCSSLEYITIPEGVKEIAGTFGQCENLQEINLPESITAIGPATFMDCSSLQHIQLPSEITELPQYVFFGCENLESIEIPETVTAIGWCAFENCKALRQVKIPENVERIEFSAFENCENLTDIFILNPDCELVIAYGENDIPELVIPLTATIHGYAGSLAEEYAKKFGHSFAPILGRNRNVPAETAIQGNATFENLESDTEYLILTVKSDTAPELLAPENILYVTQRKTDAQGNLNTLDIPVEEASKQLFIPEKYRLLKEDVTNYDLTYDGNAQTPEVEVLSDGILLEKDVDYVITGSGINVGNYPFTIDGIGAYHGNVSGVFTIKKEETTGDGNGSTGGGNSGGGSGGGGYYPTYPTEPEKPVEPGKPIEPEKPIVPEKPLVSVSEKQSAKKNLNRTVKAGKNSNTLSWGKVKGADGYIIYAAKCNSKGKTYNLKKIKTITSKNTTSYQHKKLAANTYYKYRISAYKLVDGKKVIIGTSLTLHSRTGSKNIANPTEIKVPKSTITLKKGKTAEIHAKAIFPKGKKVKAHVGVRYVVLNTDIATVSSSGKIKAKKKGKCTVYVVAQNGVSKKLTVVVK